MKKKNRLSYIIGISFMLIQLSAILYARFIPERFFCWAPYDEHTNYKINVTIEGKELSAQEVYARYRYTPEGWEPRAIHNILSIVKQYEETYGKNENAQVEIVYKTNGHNEERWKH